MKRSSLLFIFALCFCLVLSGCKKEVEQVPEEIEQVIINQVDDYSVLSVSELEVLGYENDVEAQYQLGLIFEYGSDEQQQNFSEAFKWYAMAADNGSADAVCALGYFYMNGTGVGQDISLAEEKFDEAIELGCVNANVGKARCLLTTIEIPELTLVDGVYTIAINDYAIQEDEEVSDEVLADVANRAMIYELVNEAASKNDLDGLYFLGYLYEHGIGCDFNLATAMRYYALVSESDSLDMRDQYAINSADVELGIMYLKGIGIELDTEAAMVYFNKANDNGYAPAAYYLGQIYENGIGVDKAYDKAMEYYLMAAEKEFAPALNQIGYLYYNGYGVDVDFSSAVYYQKLAALQGYAPAQVNLGYLYENGYGVERNLQTAVSYYELAAEAGYEGAEEAVVRVMAQINEET